MLFIYCFVLGKTTTNESKTSQEFEKLKSTISNKSKEIFETCIKEAADDEIFNLVKPGTFCGQMAKKIIQQISSNDASDFSKLLFEKLYVILFKNTSSDSADREKIYKNFNNLMINDSLLTQWEEYLKLNQVESTKYSSILLQYVADRYMIKLVNERKKIVCPKEKQIASRDLQLTISEENTLRYVSGYIPYSLRNKYKKLQPSNAKAALLEAINYWCIDEASDERSFLQYTEDWTDKINRGGLIKVTDEFYVFMRHVELSARNILNVNLMKTYGGENIQKLLLDEFNKNNLIDNCWSSITCRIENESLKNILKSEVLKKWINIRGNAFVKAWVDIVKKKQYENQKRKNKTKQKISKKGEASLRKELGGQK